MTFDEAKHLRSRLTTQVYPELGQYLQDQPWAAVAINLQCTEADVRQVFSWLQADYGPQQHIGWRHSTGDTPELIAQCLANGAAAEPQRAAADRTRGRAAQPGAEQASILGQRCDTLGQTAGHVGFTQRANSPFQGLAADGNKLALFRLLRAGFQVCGFVHDEMLILIPQRADYDRAVQQVQQILADAMQELWPGVPIARSICWPIAGTRTLTSSPAI